MYGRMVFQAAHRVLGNSNQAEDVQQDVFLRLIESKPAQVQSWPAYLRAAATRTAIDVLRRERRWWRLLPPWSGPEPEAPETAEDTGIDHERARRLRKALARLPQREARCFGLRYLQDMDISEISVALNLSENNIHVSLHRARRRLADLLAEPGTEKAL
jgi:RNA polymerase sigma-70 factor (ECF subfamily)